MRKKRAKIFYDRVRWNSEDGYREEQSGKNTMCFNKGLSFQNPTKEVQGKEGPWLAFPTQYKGMCQATQEITPSPHHDSTLLSASVSETRLSYK